ncbi:MAG: MFS transporter [Chloroflexota bacterium]
MLDLFSCSRMRGDAVTDPVVGNLSDRTRTKWGRRRPWLLFGAVPFGLAFLSQWIVPPFDGFWLFLYFLLASMAMKTMFTVVNVPNTTMTPEIARGYDERTSLTSYRFAFSLFGALASVIIYPTVIGAFDSPQTGNFIAAMILAVLIAVSAFVTFTFTRERPAEEHDSEESIGFFEGLKIAFQNGPFMYVVGIYLFVWLTVQFVQTNLQLYVRYWLNAEDQLTTFLLILQLTAIVSLFGWTWLSGKIGKKKSYYIGVALFLPVVIGLFFVPPGNNALVYTVCLFAGVCVAMALLLPWSMLPDVIEYDELKTGQRREGVFYGLFVFVQKIGLSLALGISSFTLDAAGYVNPAEAGGFVEQPDSVLFILRVIVSLFPMVLLLLSIPLAIRYPITRQRFEELKAELAAREA